jgi:hypothetical protein
LLRFDPADATLFSATMAVFDPDLEQGGKTNIAAAARSLRLRVCRRRRR